MDTAVIVALVGGSATVLAASTNAFATLRAAAKKERANSEAASVAGRTVASREKGAHFSYPFWAFFAIGVACTATGIAEIQDARGRIDRGALVVAVVFPAFTALLIVAETTAYLRAKVKNA